MADPGAPETRPVPAPAFQAGLDAGFVARLGLQLDEAGPDRVTAHLDVGEEHLQPYGLVHGGVFAAIAETVASVGAALAVGHAGQADRGVVGLENHTSFLRAGRRGDRIAIEAVPRHAGRRVQSWAVTMRREADGRELAVSTVRLLVVDPRGV